MLETKSFDTLESFGGTSGLLSGLGTNTDRGLSNPPSEDTPAHHVCGKNVLPPRPSKTFLQLMWLAFKDKVLILLSLAAVISVVLGLFQDFGPSRKPGEAHLSWVEGVAIMIAVLIVVSSPLSPLSSTIDYDNFRLS
jgi:Ca2+-transporting ATPase